MTGYFDHLSHYVTDNRDVCLQMQGFNSLPLWMKLKQYDRIKSIPAQKP